MKEEKRKNEKLSACGLNCCLCPRYYTNGTSKCYGCGGLNFNECRGKCSVISCCLNRGFEYCYECNDYPCDKYKNALKDSFVTHKNIFDNFDKVKKYGIDNYMDTLEEKTEILSMLLNKYNDGRRKSFYCLAINLLEINDIRDVVETIEKKLSKENMDYKEKIIKIVSLFEAKAKNRNIILKLNK